MTQILSGDEPKGNQKFTHFLFETEKSKFTNKLITIYIKLIINGVKKKNYFNKNIKNGDEMYFTTLRRHWIYIDRQCFFRIDRMRCHDYIDIFFINIASVVLAVLSRTDAKILQSYGTKRKWYNCDSALLGNNGSCTTY